MNLYYLAKNKKFEGNLLVFHKPGFAGYTSKLFEAGVFTKEQLVRADIPESTPIATEYAQRHSALTLSSEDFPVALRGYRT